MALPLLLLGVGAVLLRDGLVTLLDLRSQAWVPSALRRAAELDPSEALAVSGVLLVVLGVAFVVAGLRPRRRFVLTLRAQPGTKPETPGDVPAQLIRPRDAAQLAATAARSVSGVSSAQATVSSRAVSVHVRAAARTAPQEEIAQAVSHALRHVDDLPRLKVSRRDDQSSRRVL